jgi:solute carrier family 25 (mitochondrial folate transporter), member 32
MLSSGRNAPGAYRNMAHGVADIMRNEGIRGFWRGMVPSLFGISHGAVQFAVYEQLKRKRAAQKGGKDKLSNLDYLVTSSSSKIFAGSVTYPYQVLRVRLQTYGADRNYRGAGDAIVQIWKHEGLRGFYKGCVLCFPYLPPRR